MDAAYWPNMQVQYSMCRTGRCACGAASMPDAASGRGPRVRQGTVWGTVQSVAGNKKTEILSWAKFLSGFLALFRQWAKFLSIFLVFSLLIG